MATMTGHHRPRPAVGALTSLGVTLAFAIISKTRNAIGHTSGATGHAAGTSTSETLETSASPQELMTELKATTLAKIPGNF